MGHTTGINAKTDTTHAERSDKFEGVVNDRLVRLATINKDAAPDFIRQTPKLYMENVPEAPAAIKKSWQPYHDARGSGFLDFDTDGEIYYSIRPNREDPVQVHRTDTPLKSGTMLTQDPEGLGNAYARPQHDDEFLFSDDINGNEFTGLFLQKPDGEVIELSEPGTRNRGAWFSDDGERLIWTRSKPNSSTYTIMMMNPDDPNSRREIFSHDGSNYGGDISPDGRFMLMSRYKSITNSEYHMLDLETGEVKEVHPRDYDIAYGGAVFSGDGKSLILVTDEGSDFRRLARLDLATDTLTPLIADDKWDVETWNISDDRTKLAYVKNEDGLSKLYILDLNTGDQLPGPNLPPGLISGLTFNDDGSQLGFNLNESTNLVAPYTWDLESQDLTLWVENDLGGLSPEAFTAPEVIRYPNKNGDQIPAFVYTPDPEKFPGPRHVIVHYHGGPESQARPGFDKNAQYFVNELGAVVIRPNVRGSRGYGKDYVSLDNAENRLKSVEDAGDLLTWIGTQDNMDADRVAVMGTSYGGYMSLATATTYPDKIVGAIDDVGISHFVTFLENTEGYRRDLRRVEYGDERNLAMRDWLDRISPLTNADNIEDPLFVIQGANDPRVPMSEAEQIVSEVRSNGNETWYMLGDEGHGFGQLENIWEEREAMTMFFHKVFNIPLPSEAPPTAE